MTWNRSEDGLPEKDGRYFIMVRFNDRFMGGDRIINELIPFVSNFTLISGWLSRMCDQDVTHWMEIPEVPEER